LTDTWEPKETSTHQDHVIAHVIGATFLGYFVLDETLCVLLDIGFIWTIFLDGEMSLLPHPVAVSELEMDEESKEQVKTDIDMLLGSGASAGELLRLTLPPVECQIKDVSFFAAEDRRRLRIVGEQAGLVIETSLATAEIQVMILGNEGNNNSEGIEPEDTKTNNQLEDVAKVEHQYLHQRLRDDLGREPTEAELDEWLRQHTEGY
jgi:hypothetical protein